MCCFGLLLVSYNETVSLQMTIFAYSIFALPKAFALVNTQMTMLPNYTAGMDFSLHMLLNHMLQNHIL